MKLTNSCFSYFTEVFEILAEYKRCGISKKDIIKGMLFLGPCFVANEFLRRKKAAEIDNKNCMKVAKALGLRQTAGTKDYPIFEK